MEALVANGHNGAPRHNRRVVTEVRTDSTTGPTLMRYFTAMSQALGPMQWWPAKTPFEVIVGAILTQNTSWTNVERAIVNLRSAQMLTPSTITSARLSKLALLVRPSGYFRQKAKKLKAFVRFLHREYGGSLKRMFGTPTEILREKLLSVHGIGPETADSILLYAGNHPVFVVDAYTHRIFGRHGITDGKGQYESVRALFEAALPRDSQLFNEFHALVVNTGKNWCRKKEPRCAECPLGSLLPATSPLSKIHSAAQDTGTSQRTLA
jgi:endonuclease-3 related protein